MIVDLETRIEVDPSICGGQPRIAGRRIRVQDVAVWHEQMGLTASQIETEYNLTPAETYAALSYYHEHREDIDRAITESGQRIADIKNRVTSKLGR